MAKSGKEIAVPADQSAADVLVAQGYPIDLKCSDGLCGVCQCGLISGESPMVITFDEDNGLKAVLAVKRRLDWLR